MSLLDRNGRRLARKREAHVHKLIASTARQMAEACYEGLMQRNDWYEGWKQQHPGLSSQGLCNAFVSARWGQFVPGARHILTEQLSRPIDEELKEEIYEALCLDATLVRGRTEINKLLVN